MKARLVPILILVLVPLLAGIAGYAGGRVLRPAPAPATSSLSAAAGAKTEPPGETRIDAGQFAVQVYRPRRIDTLVTEVSVNLPAPGAAAAGTALAHARLRDRAYQVLFDAAETPAFHTPQDAAEDTPAALATTIADTLASGLGPAVPGLRGVEVRYAVRTTAPRK
ncbi:hypothetical protein [Acidimangrovimonas sediminis]|uniref:hypothetical protein n=1 Tax=Acidimangrovimonas sediminis TaxID=2056283 RepID=UPI000C80F692|nr:hypothetical protein [Acidimangrovimonas sediminis]